MSHNLMRFKQDFNDLFKPAEATNPALGFWVRGRLGRWIIDGKVVVHLKRAGWVYDVTPGTTYFEVIVIDGDEYVFAKYQFIIGSRRLCRLKWPGDCK